MTTSTFLESNDVSAPTILFGKEPFGQTPLINVAATVLERKYFYRQINHHNKDIQAIASIDAINPLLISNETSGYQETQFNTRMQESKKFVISRSRTVGRDISDLSSLVIDLFKKIYENTMWDLILSRLEEKGFRKNAARIKELIEFQGFEEGEQPLSLESAQGFQEFICEFCALGEPILGLFPEGTLSAGWRIADNKHLIMDFLDSNIVSFALIGPDGNAADKKFRLNGRGNQKKIIKILAKNGVEEWPVPKV